MSNEVNRKSFSYRTAIVVGIIASILWLLISLRMFSPDSYGPMMTAIIPFGCLLLAWYKHRIGGLLTILSSFVPIITISAIAGTSSDPIMYAYIILPLLFVTLPLFIAGIIIYRASPREIPTKV